MPDESVPPPRVGRRSDPPVPRTNPPLFEVTTPRPTAAVFVTAWPVIALVLVGSFLFATFFPALGGLLLVAAPPAVFAAFAFAAIKARGIRLVVTDEVVRVSNGKAGYACDRSQVQSALLVAGLKRRVLAPRTTDLFLVDHDGHSVMMLSGRLWPTDLLEQVMALVAPNDAQRLPGPQSLASVQAQYPKLFAARRKGPTQN